MQAYVLVPASLEVTKRSASFISHCGAGLTRLVLSVRVYQVNPYTHYKAPPPRCTSSISFLTSELTLFMRHNQLSA